MAKVVPIRWQGANRTRQLRALVLEQSLAWLQGWAAKAEKVRCEVECFPSNASRVAGSDDAWLAMSGKHGSLWWRASPAAIEGLGRTLVHSGQTDGLGLAEAIGRRALSDLSTQWVGADKTVGLVGGSVPAAGALDPRHGVVGFCWTLDEFPMDLYFDSSLCAAMVPPTPHPVELSSRSEAIGPSQLTLHAVLDMGMASLDDTRVLRPGEVIKTGIALSQPLRVQTESGTTVFTGALVANESHRALRFASHRQQDRT